MSWLMKNLFIVSAYLILDSPSCLVINAHGSIENHVEQYQESLFESMPYSQTVRRDFFSDYEDKEGIVRPNMAQYLPYSTDGESKREKLVNEDHMCQGASCKMNDASHRRHHHKRPHTFHPKRKEKWRNRKKMTSKHKKLYRKQHNNGQHYDNNADRFSMKNTDFLHKSDYEKYVMPITNKSYQHDLVKNVSKLDNDLMRGDKLMSDEAKNPHPTIFNLGTGKPLASSFSGQPNLPKAQKPIKIMLHDISSPSVASAKNTSHHSQTIIYIRSPNLSKDNNKHLIEDHFDVTANISKLLSSPKILIKKTVPHSNKKQSDSSINKDLETPLQSDKDHDSKVPEIKTVKDTLSSGRNSGNRKYSQRNKRLKPRTKSPSYISYLRQSNGKQLCYSMTDLLMVIIITTIANLFAVSIVIILVCCFSTRFRRSTSSRHGKGYGVVENRLESNEEETSGTVGCLEACLPDISYQRHIARGFTKKIGKLQGPRHRRRHDPKFGAHTSTSPLLGRKSLSLENIRIT